MKPRSGPAGRHLVFGEILQPHMPTGHANPERRNDHNEPGIEGTTHGAGVLNRGGEEDHAQRDRRNTLQHAERTRLQTETMLEIQRARHHADAGEEAGKIAGARIHQDIH